MIEDPKCAEKHNFDPENPALSLYIHSQFKEFRLQGPNDNLSLEYLMGWLSVKYVQVRLSWGKRAAYLMESQNVSALLYILEKPVPTENLGWLDVVIGNTAATVREKTD